MRPFRFVLISVVLLGLTACESPVVTHHKLLLNVELNTPEGVRRGQTVIEIAFRRVYDPLAGSQCHGRAVQPYRTEVFGEAIPIDLADGRTVYALLTTYSGTGPTRFMYNAYVEHQGLIGRNLCTTWGDVAAENRMLDDLKEPADLGVPNDPYRWQVTPVLAMFGNSADPRSIYILDGRNLSASLGTGYAVRRVTIAPTSDPVTEGLVKRLPWLANRPPARLEPYAVPTEGVLRYPNIVLRSNSLKSPGPCEEQCSR